jgi:thioredoxin-related protein
MVNTIPKKYPPEFFLEDILIMRDFRLHTCQWCKQLKKRCKQRKQEAK